MKVELTYVGFNKQGHAFPFREMESGDVIKTDWLPAVYDKGEYQGLVWLRDERGKARPATLLQLGRMRNYSWAVEEVLEVYIGPKNKKPDTAKMRVYLGLDGERRIVPGNIVSLFSLGLEQAGV